MNAHNPHLTATPCIDSDHPAVVAFASTHAQGSNDRDRAVALYLAVRDGLRYDPYRIDLSEHGMKASTALAQGSGWCVPKAVALAAVARAAGIPARLGFADVRNHLSTERLRRTMQTDVFAWHGYTELWIDGGWRKATPAFNLSPCDRAGQRHMGSVAERGSFDDLPLGEITATFAAIYPGLLAASAATPGDFAADAAREAGSASA